MFLLRLLCYILLLGRGLFFLRLGFLLLFVLEFFLRLLLFNRLWFLLRLFGLFRVLFWLGCLLALFFGRTFGLFFYLLLFVFGLFRELLFGSFLSAISRDCT